jgi:FkbM family methyltransferase
MSFRKSVKRWLYGSCPGFAGAFPYFGTKVYFPKGSQSFLAACEQGIFEADNARLLQGLCRPGSHMFDVGANIGLMALPVLQSVPDCKIVSFEPSPNTLPWLERTISGSAYSARWTLVPKAVGANTGLAEFSLSPPELSLFDGLKATQRVPESRRVQVQVTTLDSEWDRLGRPDVSVVKVDVEGGELNVLSGATECLRKNRASVLLEWNATNLKAYGCQASAIFDFALKINRGLFAMPHLVPIHDTQELALQMIKTETFLLSPGPPN